MGVIYDICDEVAVMRDGRIEETGEKETSLQSRRPSMGSCYWIVYRSCHISNETVVVNIVEGKRLDAGV